MNPLKQAWLEGRTTFNAWLMLPGPAVAETMACQPWDSVTIDMQHGLIDYSEVVPMLLALDVAGRESLVRVPGLEPGIIGKVLDAGASGVICPVVNSAEEAHQFVQFMRYPPQGVRSMGPLRPVFRQGPGYLDSANANCLAIAQIETSKALDNLEDILQVEGLDAIYIGPSDLAMDLGLPPMPDSENPELLEVIEGILAAARQKAVPAAMHCMSFQYAQKMQKMGFDLITAGADFKMIMDGSARTLEALKGKVDAESGSGKSLY